VNLAIYCLGLFSLGLIVNYWLGSQFLIRKHTYLYKIFIQVGIALAVGLIVWSGEYGLEFAFMSAVLTWVFLDPAYKGAQVRVRKAELEAEISKHREILNSNYGAELDSLSPGTRIRITYKLKENLDSFLNGKVINKLKNEGYRFDFSKKKLFKEGEITLSKNLLRSEIEDSMRQIIEMSIKNNCVYLGAEVSKLIKEETK
jgi:hypothetical protein